MLFFFIKWPYGAMLDGLMRSLLKSKKSIGFSRVFGKMKNQDYRKNWNFFVKRLSKKIKIYIFLLSLTSSIQPCIKKTKKKFVEILHYAHLTIIGDERLSDFIQKKS